MQYFLVTFDNADGKTEELPVPMDLVPAVVRLALVYAGTTSIQIAPTAPPGQ